MRSSKSCTRQSGSTPPPTGERRERRRPRARARVRVEEVDDLRVAPDGRVHEDHVGALVGLARHGTGPRDAGRQHQPQVALLLRRQGAPVVDAVLPELARVDRTVQHGGRRVLETGRHRDVRDPELPELLPQVRRLLVRLHGHPQLEARERVPDVAVRELLLLHRRPVGREVGDTLPVRSHPWVELHEVRTLGQLHGWNLHRPADREAARLEPLPVAFVGRVQRLREAQRVLRAPRSQDPGVDVAHRLPRFERDRHRREDALLPEDRQDPRDVRRVVSALEEDDDLRIVGRPGPLDVHRRPCLRRGRGGPGEGGRRERERQRCETRTADPSAHGSPPSGAPYHAAWPDLSEALRVNCGPPPPPHG